MTRAGLEAVIWRHARMLTGTLPERVHAVDTILASAVKAGLITMDEFKPLMQDDFTPFTVIRDGSTP